MRKLFPILFLALALPGCATMTEEQKQQAWLTVGAAVVVGAIAASQDGGDRINCHNSVIVRPDGSTPITTCQ